MPLVQYLHTVVSVLNMKPHWEWRFISKSS